MTPAGGERWAGGSLHDITWQAADNRGLGEAPISIEYSLDSGSSWHLLAAGETNDGVYGWSLPATDSSQALVRVSAIDAAGNTGRAASSAFAIDATAPTVQGKSPAADAVRVAPGSGIAVVFSEEMAGESISSASLSLRESGSGIEVPANVSYDAASRIASLRPPAALAGATGYTVTVGGMTDLAGNALAAQQWSFTTSREAKRSYYFTWYDARPEYGMDGDWLLVGNRGSEAAAVAISIGGREVDSFMVNPGAVAPRFFPGLSGGPVIVYSHNDQELLVSQRVHYRRSFNEIAAVRGDELSSEYIFTWYDNKRQHGMNGNWILVANDFDAAADVYIEIAGQRMRDPVTGSERFNIPAGGLIAPFFPNLMGGPVKISCADCAAGQNLIASQRVHYLDSLSEVMAMPVSALDREYIFSWYDFKPEHGMGGDWILVGNDIVQDQYFEIYIGAEKMSGPEASGRFKVSAGQSVFPIFPGKMGGPVQVVCSSCASGQNLIASQRVHYQDSFEEVQGTSPRDLGDSAVFNWYDFKPEHGMSGDWIIVGNTSSAAADVYISIGGTAMLNPVTWSPLFPVASQAQFNTSFLHRMGGPVEVACPGCSAGQKLIISQRVHYLNSFNELVGRPPRSP